MQTITKAAILVVAAGALHSAGIGLLSASAHSRAAVSEQSHIPTTLLSQYSDNPTIPGSGTPQRSQGSGTR